MKQCNCGSFAINIDVDRQVCDVCYWKNKYKQLQQQVKDYEYILNDVEQYTNDYGYYLIEDVLDKYKGE